MYKETSQMDLICLEPQNNQFWMDGNGDFHLDLESSNWNNH